MLAPSLSVPGTVPQTLATAPEDAVLEIMIMSMAAATEGAVTLLSSIMMTVWPSTVVSRLTMAVSVGVNTPGVAPSLPMNKMLPACASDAGAVDAARQANATNFRD